MDAGGKVKPGWPFLRESDRAGVKSLLKRLARPRKQRAVSDDLCVFLGDGYVDRDAARGSLVSFFEALIYPLCNIHES